MKKLLKYLKVALVVSFFFGGTLSASTQISFPDDVNDEAPAAPIDGLVIIVVAAGAILGICKQKQE